MALLRRRIPADPDHRIGDGSEEPVRAEVVDTPPPFEPPAPPDPDADLPPSRLRGTEPMYGYVVGLELLTVGILNLVVRHGAGAPAHPQTALQVVGVAASIAFMGLISVRNRTVAGLAAIFAAFFVTLPRPPNSLQAAHILALVFPLIYGVLITQRQRRAVSRTLGGRRGAARTGMAARARQRDDQQAQARGGERRGRSRRGGKGNDTAPAGPRPSARYTPPKAKRGR
ncbi:MAG: hypothetical protein M0Z30_19430 [Actinomycetota bacterium]|nr:hypothetical protein [Actinomycetota bacterium]